MRCKLKPQNSVGVFGQSSKQQPLSFGMATATSSRAVSSLSLARSAFTSQKAGSPSPSLALPLRTASRVRAEVGTTTSASAESTPAAGKKVPPLARGGTLSGKEAAGKDPAASTLGAPPKVAVATADKFTDPRWVGGTWDLAQFTKEGNVDWDAVIDAGEGSRLEQSHSPVGVF